MSTDSPLQDFRPFFDSLAPKRERDASKHRLYYADQRRWLTRLIPPSASVIEIGCGTGLSISGLPNAKKTGIDFSSEMIRMAKDRDSTTQYVVDDVLRLSHAEQYDYVLLLDTINYVNDVQKTLESVRHNLCHKRTRVIVTYYNFLWQPFFIVAEFLGWKTRFPEQNWLNRRDVENLLRLADFEIVQGGERILCPVWIPLLSTLCNRYLVSLPFFRLFSLIKYVVARPVIHEKTNYSVSVLSAVRNEKGNIQRIIDTMPVMGSKTELLFIEGHSNDGTWEEMQRAVGMYRGPLEIRALKQTGRGKANALHEGAEQSMGDILFIYDGDFTVHPEDLAKLYDAMASGRAEFMNASRLVYPMREGAMRVLNLLGNKTFSVLFSWLFNQQLVDVLSPVKGLFREHYPAVTTRLDPFGDFDFFLGAGSLQLKMVEVPVHYYERVYGTTKIRRFHHGMLLFKMFLFGAKKLKWI